MDPSARQEADALLLVLRMAERHERWKLFQELLEFVEDAGGRVGYQGPGMYAVQVP